jgi:fumarate reductase flavoprotein subunit
LWPTRSFPSEAAADGGVEVLSSDVVVVGAGLAGVTAALRARELGARVMLLEKSTDPSGWSNSRMSGGKFHAAGLPPTAAPGEIMARVAQETRGVYNAPLAQMWAENCARAYDWLRGHGVRFAHLWGVPVFAPVRPNRRGEVWRGYGCDVAIRRLLTSFDGVGGDRRHGFRATEIGVHGSGAVLRAVETAGGRGLRIETGAVVFADGGFQAAPEMLARYASVVSPAALVTRGAGTGEGECAAMAISVGGALVDASALYAHILHRDALAKGNPELIYFPVLDHLIAPGLVVDQSGQRFLDETLGGVAAANRIARLHQPDGAWLIIDQAAWSSRARGHNQIVPPDPNLLLARAEIIAAPTVERLAARAGLDHANLARSMAEIEPGAPAGPDSHAPRAGAPVRLDPPYYAIPLAVGLTSTMGGIAVDARMNVVTSSGGPIKGVFAAGACVGGLSGGPTPGYVGGLSVAATLGLAAAESALAEAGCAQ